MDLNILSILTCSSLIHVPSFLQTTCLDPNSWLLYLIFYSLEKKLDTKTRTNPGIWSLLCFENLFTEIVNCYDDYSIMMLLTKCYLVRYVLSKECLPKLILNHLSVLVEFAVERLSDIENNSGRSLYNKHNHLAVFYEPLKVHASYPILSSFSHCQLSSYFLPENIIFKAVTNVWM